MKKIIAMMVAAMAALSFSMIAVASEAKKEEAAPAAEKVEMKDAKKDTKKEVKKDAKKDKKKAEAKPAAKGKKELSGC